MDFLRGESFADFDFVPDDASQQRLLQAEADGVSWRTERFLNPLIRRYARIYGKTDSVLAVLDCGCGGGLSVEILRSYRIAAYGIDAGRARHAQWHARTCGRYLHSANALHLPFPTGSFDVVLSSGLIEHIGIQEEQHPRFSARRLPDCDAQRQEFINELVRVLKPDGFILLDHPNGGSPADFWHGGKPGSIRWHRLHEDMLPRFDEVAAYFAQADGGLALCSLSPSHRLSFRRIRSHWYGIAFTPLVKTFFRLIELPSPW
jgi:SAM-dependent methyltransferase